MPYIWIHKVRYRQHLPNNQHCHFIFRVLYKSISMYTEIVKKKKISINVILLLISFIHWYIISTITIMKEILSVWSLNQLNQYHLLNSSFVPTNLCTCLYFWSFQLYIILIIWLDKDFQLPLFYFHLIQKTSPSPKVIGPGASGSYKEGNMRPQSLSFWCHLEDCLYGLTSVQSQKTLCPRKILFFFLIAH